MGRVRSNCMINLGAEGVAQKVLYDMGLNLEEIEEAEAEAGLDNGSLGKCSCSVNLILDKCPFRTVSVLFSGEYDDVGPLRIWVRHSIHVWYVPTDKRWLLQCVRFRRSVSAEDHRRLSE